MGIQRLRQLGADGRKNRLTHDISELFRLSSCCGKLRVVKGNKDTACLRHVCRYCCRIDVSCSDATVDSPQVMAFFC